MLSAMDHNDLRTRLGRYVQNPLAALRRPVLLAAFSVAGCTFAGPDATPGPGDSTDSIALELVADGFAAPVGLVDPGDGSGRVFVIDQIGRIEIIDAAGDRVLTPFLDVTDRVIDLSTAYDERGLLGLAFHPDYAINGRFFVYYTAPPDADGPADFNAENRVSEFTVSPTDSDLADVNSERVLLEINQPRSNHNAGQLAFGPDEYLYIATGDGGGGNDTGFGHTPEVGNGQDTSRLLGKILRIDVDGDAPYAIPPDNPFVSDASARPEIWAFGLRNPWRFSFDSGGARRLFAGDVGQNRFEEIDIIERGGNYGWNVREGAHCFDPSDPGSPPNECQRIDTFGNTLIDPIIEYSHVDSQSRRVGISAIGGFIYRGGALPHLQGQYIFADYSTSFLPDGSLFAATEDAAGVWAFRELSVAETANGRVGRYILALGRDATQELYVLTSAASGPSGVTGRVYKIVPTP